MLVNYVAVKNVRLPLILVSTYTSSRSIFTDLLLTISFRSCFVNKRRLSNETRDRDTTRTRLRIMSTVYTRHDKLYHFVCYHIHWVGRLNRKFSSCCAIGVRHDELIVFF